MTPIKDHCKWLMVGKKEVCGNPCIKDYCSYHKHNFRYGSNGPAACIDCGVGVKGKSKLCLDCESKQFRSYMEKY